MLLTATPRTCCLPAVRSGPRAEASSFASIRWRPVRRSWPGCPTAPCSHSTEQTSGWEEASPVGPEHSFPSMGPPGPWCRERRSRGRSAGSAPWAGPPGLPPPRINGSTGSWQHPEPRPVEPRDLSWLLRRRRPGSVGWPRSHRDRPQRPPGQRGWATLGPSDRPAAPARQAVGEGRPGGGLASGSQPSPQAGRSPFFFASAPPPRPGRRADPDRPQGCPARRGRHAAASR